ncbi:MAG: hypothetical protein K0S39_2139 [Paenibacillus sp.]|nr:hypothetical protein [Paenibacillus sp.]
MPCTVFLYIWGTQWVLSSCIDFFGQWEDVGRWQQLTVWLALASSLAALISSYRSGTWKQLADLGSKAALPLLMIIGAVSILQYVHAVDLFFAPLLKSFVLAICYALLGTWLGRPLVYMSLWLFTLTAVVAVWYLGFASMLLGGFGGLSMITLAWMLRRWNPGIVSKEVSQ